MTEEGVRKLLWMVLIQKGYINELPISAEKQMGLMQWLVGES